jgi:hypothetical protein
MIQDDGYTWMSKENQPVPVPLPVPLPAFSHKIEQRESIVTGMEKRMPILIS